MLLAIIQVRQNGYEEAVALNGNIITTTEPGNDASKKTINDIANNLAAALQIDIKRFNVTPGKDWSWEYVIEQMKANKILVSNTSSTTILLDAVICDWQLTAGEDTAAYVPEENKCQYSLRIEKDTPADKIWISVYNKASDEHGDKIHKSGLHCSIEIRDGVPALSAGISPDENVVHILSNTSNKLAVIPEYEDRGTWTPVDFTEAKHIGYCFDMDDYGSLMEARSELANKAFEQFDFGERVVIDDSGWDIKNNLWQKVVFFENQSEGDSLKGIFELIFTENGTHIVSTKEI